MIGRSAVPAVAGAPDPVAEDGRVGGRHAAPDGRRRATQGGDFLPNEAELMAHFGVSRPTLREAVRVLESERLVEARRGSRTGARVRVPGLEIVHARRACCSSCRGHHRRCDDGPRRYRADGGPVAHRDRERRGVRRTRHDDRRARRRSGRETGRMAETTGDFHHARGRAVRQRDADHHGRHAARRSRCGTPLWR